GPVDFYATFAALLVPIVVSVLLIAWRLRDRHAVRGTARWARPTDMRLLRVRKNRPGRLTLGRNAGKLVAAEQRQSAIVVGPTQTGKTTGFAIPAILEWDGPVVATSVKTDLLADTLARRTTLDGRVWVYDPSGATGRRTATW